MPSYAIDLFFSFSFLLLVWFFRQIEKERTDFRPQNIDENGEEPLIDILTLNEKIMQQFGRTGDAFLPASALQDGREKAFRSNAVGMHSMGQGS